MSRTPIKPELFAGCSALAGLLGPLAVSTEMRKLDNVRLLTCSHAIDSLTTSAIEGVRVMGDLITMYDTKRGPLDCNTAGGLVSFLGAMLTELSDLSYVATDELAARGYTPLGGQIESSTQEPSQ